MRTTTKKILDRIKKEIARSGTPLWKVGAVICPDSKSRQGRTVAAKSFLAGQPRACSLERVERISKFYKTDFFVPVEKCKK